MCCVLADVWLFFGYNAYVYRCCCCCWLVGIQYPFRFLGNKKRFLVLVRCCTWLADGVCCSSIGSRVLRCTRKEESSVSCIELFTRGASREKKKEKRQPAVGVQQILRKF